MVSTAARPAIQIRMRVGHRHSDICMTYLRLTVRQRHTNLLAQGGVSVPEDMPTQPSKPEALPHWLDEPSQ